MNATGLGVPGEKQSKNQGPSPTPRAKEQAPPCTQERPPAQRVQARRWRRKDPELGKSVKAVQRLLAQCSGSSWVLPYVL